MKEERKLATFIFCAHSFGSLYSGQDIVVSLVNLTAAEPTRRLPAWQKPSSSLVVNHARLQLSLICLLIFLPSVASTSIGGRIWQHNLALQLFAGQPRKNVLPLILFIASSTIFTSWYDLYWILWMGILSPFEILMSSKQNSQLYLL